MSQLIAVKQSPRSVYNHKQGGLEDNEEGGVGKSTNTRKILHFLNTSLLSTLGSLLEFAYRRVCAMTVQAGRNMTPGRSICSSSIKPKPLAGMEFQDL